MTHAGGWAAARPGAGAQQRIFLAASILQTEPTWESRFLGFPSPGAENPGISEPGGSWRPPLPTSLAEGAARGLADLPRVTWGKVGNRTDPWCERRRPGHRDRAASLLTVLRHMGPGLWILVLGEGPGWPLGIHPACDPASWVGPASSTSQDICWTSRPVGPLEFTNALSQVEDQGQRGQGLAEVGPRLCWALVSIPSGRCLVCLLGVSSLGFPIPTSFLLL